MSWRELIFVDTETTGLKAGVQEVIEIACIVTNHDASKILDTYSAQMMPLRPEKAEARALEINHFHTRWTDPSVCKSQAEVAKEFNKRASGRTFVGWNSEFDLGFLKAFLLEQQMKPSWHWYTLDGKQLWYPHAVHMDQEKMSLQDVAGYLGIPYVDGHTAMGDTKITLEVFRTMLHAVDSST